MSDPVEGFNIIKFITENKLISGLGTAVFLAITGTIAYFYKKNDKKNDKKNGKDTDSSVFDDSTDNEKITKKDYEILFIDDEKFPVIDILKKAGWESVNRIKDVKNFEEPLVSKARVFFVDIHGVGKMMGFADEGLGLAVALKKKFPLRKVVIYSAIEEGDRFHNAFSVSDDQLAKNADPFEFIQIIQNFHDHE